MPCIKKKKKFIIHIYEYAYRSVGQSTVIICTKYKRYENIDICVMLNLIPDS